jgi:hypothetical protein
MEGHRRASEDMEERRKASMPVSPFGTRESHLAGRESPVHGSSLASAAPLRPAPPRRSPTTCPTRSLAKSHSTPADLETSSLLRPGPARPGPARPGHAGIPIARREFGRTGPSRDGTGRAGPGTRRHVMPRRAHRGTSLHAVPARASSFPPPPPRESCSSRSRPSLPRPRSQARDPAPAHPWRIAP